MRPTFRLTPLLHGALSTRVVFIADATLAPPYSAVNLIFDTDINTNDVHQRPRVSDKKKKSVDYWRT